MFFHSGPGGATWDTGVASYENGQAELDPTGQAEARWIHQHRHSIA
jgi:hypothetical protein